MQSYEIAVAQLYKEDTVKKLFSNNNFSSRNIQAGKYVQ